MGPLQKLMDDPEITEIMVNGPRKVFVEKSGKKILTDVAFTNEDELITFVQKVYESRDKRVGGDIVYADTCLEDGTRLNVILYPCARFGLTLTIRKFSSSINTLEDLIARGALNRKAADLLIACIKGKINILFSGGTGVGKTTLLQNLSAYFAVEERVITIEDAAELKIERENWVSLETKAADAEGRGGVTLRDLVLNALRMTPNRIILGEVRGAEAIDMIQAMATGHTGTLSIIHGSSPKDVIGRLETMLLMSGLNLPLSEIRKMITSTLNLVVHVERMLDGARRITSITEIRGVEQGEIVLNDLFTFQADRVEDGKIYGELKSVIRNYPNFFHKFQKMGLLTYNVFSTT
jgi:pilus assembly protein CpaF